MAYEFGGLPVGMGATLGQFIRRSVYCQRAKWDIIGFRINDLHEFSTIPNSTDMVTDLLPKFKDMHFTLKPELEQILEENLQDSSRVKFNLKQFSDSVDIFRTMQSGEASETAVVSISLFVDDTNFSSTDLETWFNIRNPMVFCKMLEQTRLRVTLYLMKVQGTMSAEEAYACISSVGIATSGNSAQESIIYLPGSNRGDFDVICTYRESIGKDVLEVTLKPDNSETRAAVIQSVMEALQTVSGILRTMNDAVDS